MQVAGPLLVWLMQTNGRKGGGSGQRREAEVDGDGPREEGLSTHVFVLGKHLKRLFRLKG